MVRARGLARSIERSTGSVAARFLWTPANKRGWGALRLTTVGRKVRARAQRHHRLSSEDGPNLVALAINGWDEGHRPRGGSTSRRARRPSVRPGRASGRARCAPAQFAGQERASAVAALGRGRPAARRAMPARRSTQTAVIVLEPRGGTV